MGQVHVHVTLTNYREAIMARLGQFDASRIHRYETEALIDTGAIRSVLPPRLQTVLGFCVSIGQRQNMAIVVWRKSMSLKSLP
jgi:hypothetical protein